MYKSNKEYYRYKENLENRYILKRYFYLSSLENLTFEQREAFNEYKNSQSLAKYNWVNKIIYMIENVFTDQFMDRYEQFKKFNVSTISLVHLSQCRFSDGLPVRNWVEAVVDSSFKAFGLDILSDKEYDAFKDVLVCYYSKENKVADQFRRTLIDFKNNASKLSTMLGVSPTYLDRLVCGYVSVSEELRDQLLYFINKIDVSELNDREEHSIELLKNILVGVTFEEKQVEEKEPDYVYLCEKLKKLYESVVANKYTDINKKTGLPHDTLVAWWAKANSIVNLGNGPDDLKHYVRKIKYELYDNSNIAINPKSSVNYGRALYRVLIGFGFNDEVSRFDAIKIPNSYLNQIFANKIIPTKQMLDKISFFLNILVTNDSELLYELSEAKRIFEIVKNEIEFVEPDVLEEFEILGLNNISKYEAVVDFDAEVLKRVKDYNLDWYYKYVTCYYVVDKLGNNTWPSNLFFYDGSIVRKWFQTQKRVLNNNSKTGVPKFNDDQRLLFQDLLQFRVDNMTMLSIEEVVLAQFDELVKYFKDIIDSGVFKLPNIKMYGYPVNKLWNYIYKEYISNKTIFNTNQLNVIRELRRNYVDLVRDNNLDYGYVNLDFGKYLYYLLDDFGWTGNDFADITECSISNYRVYVCNKTLPTTSAITKIITSLENLDKTQYREDQLQTLCDFVKLFDLVNDESKLRNYVFERFELEKTAALKNIIYGDTDDVFEDVPSSYLMSVEASDPAWMENYMEVVNCNYSTYRNYIINPSLQCWYRNNVIAAYNGTLSFDKVVLMGYLSIKQKNNKLKNKIEFFEEKCNALEEFLIVNMRLPYEKEYVFEDGMDLLSFYLFIKNVMFVNNEKSNGFSTEDFICIKDLISLVYSVEHPLMRRDDISDEEMYLGMKLEYLRISLGMTLCRFCECFEVTMSSLRKLLLNKKSLTNYKEKLLSKLKEFDYSSLREDQIIDIEDFVSVLESGRLYSQDMSMSLKNNG